MIKLVRTYTRPDTSTPWHGEVLLSSIVEANLEKYKTDQKLLHVETSLSEDELIFTWIGYFSSEEAFTEYDTDPSLQEFWETRKMYCDVVGIIISPKDISTVDTIPA